MGTPDAGNRERSYHVLSFHWDDFCPVLRLYDMENETVEDIRLEAGMEFSLTAGERKFCVGKFGKEGYTPCPEQREVSRFNQCQECAAEFIPNLECIFEPKCDGELCDTRFCKKEHAVYLALFKDDVKVGMTGRERAMKRLIEQGADAYTILAVAPTRSNARALEQGISKRLRIPEFYGFQRFVKGLMNEVTAQSMEKIYDFYTMRVRKEFALQPGELRFLENYPMPSSVNGRVYVKNSDTGCAGRVVGVKGKCLVFRKDFYAAVNLSILPGRMVKGYFQELPQEDEGT